MKYTDRAFLAVRRRKKVTLQLAIIFFVLFAVLLIGLGILYGVYRAGVELRQTFASGFQIEVSPATREAYSVPRDPPVEGLNPVVYTGEWVTKEQIHKIASTEGIIGYDACNDLACLRSDELTLFPGLWIYSYNLPGLFDSLSKEDQESNIGYMYCPRYEAHFSSELAPEFRTGKFTLVEGRHITENDTHAVLMSDELAQKNGLAVGDSYYAYYDDAVLMGLFPMQKPIEFDFEIVGLFHVNVNQVVGEYTSENEIYKNYIYTDIHTAEEYSTGNVDTPNSFDWEPIYFGCTFFVEDPAELDTVMERARAREDINWEFFTLSVDESSYQSALEPLQSMNTALWIAVAVVTLAMAILLYLVLRMSLQGRIREIKLYRALGIGKKQIWAQFVLECVLIAVLAFVPAAAVSAVSTNAVGNALLTVSTGSEEQRQPPTDAEWEQAALNGTTQQLQEELAAMEMDNTPDEIDAGLPLVPTVGILFAVLVLTGGFLLYQLRDVFCTAAMLHY